MIRPVREGRIDLFWIDPKYPSSGRGGRLSPHAPSRAEFDDKYSFVSRAFLQSELDIEFKVYAESGVDETLLARLRAWNDRSTQMSEVQLEAGFIQAFFVETWGYTPTGAGGDHTLVRALAVEIDAIEAEEQAMNETLYALYDLTTQERLLVETDIAARR